MIFSSQYGGEMRWWTGIILHKEHMYVAICATCRACTLCWHVLSKHLCVGCLPICTEPGGSYHIKTGRSVSISKGTDC